MARKLGLTQEFLGEAAGEFFVNSEALSIKSVLIVGCEGRCILSHDWHTPCLSRSSHEGEFNLEGGGHDELRPLRGDPQHAGEGRPQEMVDLLREAGEKDSAREYEDFSRGWNAAGND